MRLSAGLRRRKDPKKNAFGLLAHDDNSKARSSLIF
jgi:hypothetical protein